MQARAGKRRCAAALAVLCLGLLCAAAGRVLLPARAEKDAPTGCSMESPRPAQKSCFVLDAKEWWLSDAYGWRTDPFTGEKAFHRGADLACAEGTPVLAAMEGIVTVARRNGSYGSYVRLCHTDGQETVYAHLQYAFVRAGELVRSGQTLGTVGATGRATGAHLHFELLVQGGRCDPSALLGLP